MNRPEWKANRRDNYGIGRMIRRQQLKWQLVIFTVLFTVLLVMILFLGKVV